METSLAMDVRVVRETVGGFSVPKCSHLSELHECMRRLGMKFLQAWTPDDCVFMTIQEIDTRGCGRLFERWGNDNGFVVLRIHFRDKVSKRRVYSEDEDTEEVIARAYKVRNV